MIGVVAPVKRGRRHAGGAEEGALAIVPRGCGGGRVVRFEGV